MKAIFKQLISVVIFTMIGLIVSAQKNADDILNAKWKCDDGRSMIEFYKMSDGTYCSKIVWLREPNDKNGNPVLDKNNPDKAGRNKPILGMTYSKNIRFENGKWVTDHLYSPEHGIVATGEIWMENLNTLKVKGKKFLITQTQTFVRAN